jgi:hypothetical protein
MFRGANPPIIWRPRQTQQISFHFSAGFFPIFVVPIDKKHHNTAAEDTNIQAVAPYL